MPSQFELEDQEDGSKRELPNDIYAAQAAIYLAAQAAKVFTGQFLEQLQHQKAPGFFNRSNNTALLKALELMRVATLVTELFKGESKLVDSEKQEAYRKLLAALIEIMQSPDAFSLALKSSGVMDAVSASISVLLYQKAEIFPQVKNNLLDHLKLAEQKLARQLAQADLTVDQTRSTVKFANR